MVDCKVDSKGPGITQQQESDLLWTYVSANRPKKVEALLKHDVYLEGRDEIGQTPLHYAEDKGHEEIVALLQDFRPSVDALGG